MSFSQESRRPGVADAVKNWFRKGADAESVGLEPGWEYLDLSEFGDVPATPAKATHKRAAEHVQSGDSLSDIVADVITDSESSQSEFDVTERVNKRGKHVIAVLSGKGGVGKTTTLLGLAGAAAANGKSVLLVDLDPQGSLSLAALDGEVGRSAREAFDGATLAELAVATVWKDFDGAIDIVPANRHLGQIDVPLSPMHAYSSLVDRLGDLTKYDVVLIDAPATLATLAFEAIALAHKVVVVTEPTRFAITSAADAADFARLSRRGKRSWNRSVHILLNKFDGSEESTFRSREVQRNFPGEVLKTSISMSGEVDYANSAGVPVQAIPGVRADLAARQFEVLLSELTD